MAKQLPPGHILTPEVRLSFPALFKPKPRFRGADENKLTYQATLLIPPDCDLTPFREAMKAAIFAKWEKMVVLPAKGNPIHPCAEKPDLDGYDEGWHYIACHSQRPPGVVDRNNVPLSDETRVYPGVWAKAYINAFAWDHPVGGRGVSFGLNGIQIVRDDERLGGGAMNVADVFEPLGEQETGGGLNEEMFR